MAEKGSSSTNTTLSLEQLLNKLFVGGLYLAIDDNEMKSYLEHYWTVVDSIVMMDQVQGWSHRFGFITYEEGCEDTQKDLAAIPHSIRDEVMKTFPIKCGFCNSSSACNFMIWFHLATAVVENSKLYQTK